MVDSGFPVGGREPREEVWTPEAVTFQNFCMSKTKESGPLGGVRRAHPLDPPMDNWHIDHNGMSCVRMYVAWDDELPGLLGTR